MSELRGARVFVTGADGFIGSHLVETLVKAGAKVRALVYYNSWNSTGWLSDVPADVLKQVEIFTGDVRDAERIKEAIAGVSHVFHLASLIGIPYSYEAPQSYLDTNIGGTLNVLEACRRSSTLVRLVHTSTSEVYGTAQTVPIAESHPLVGQSPYSATKIGADKLAESFHRSFGLPVVTARPFNTFGPRQTARFLMEATQRDIPIVCESERTRPAASEVNRLIADASRLRTLTGWSPATGFREGLWQTVDWIKKNQNRFVPEQYVR